MFRAEIYIIAVLEPGNRHPLW